MVRIIVGKHPNVDESATVAIDVMLHVPSAISSDKVNITIMVGQGEGHFA